MKPLATITMVAGTVIALAACNNASKSSVNNADSVNSAKIDSGEVSLTSDETAFMVKAANGGMTEIQFSKQAQQNSNSQRVKDFADMIIKDHTAADEQLSALARDQNVTLPDSLSGESKSDLAKLSRKKGDDFDKDYIRSMVKDHRKAVDDFKDALDKVTNIKLKAFIRNTLPTLQKHLDSAQVIDSVLSK